ncbi:hypothetical protein EDEG_00745 [Edhazardia aedis USNM 41457]|uniref:Uncharacterized protein n=1 Tax=Edhazardia aedis (strain USNM 41457) TaxID=1003232 RepID=J9DCH6_EDHAE|nr:hypothetical protein EDEG_00745 [Edhazardia aedis USNM 41457]|eukprot:EJW05164.1 hypothetical protein EDEG_00745 [Edhazardia aedis USNM 41457]
MIRRKMKSFIGGILIAFLVKMTFCKTPGNVIRFCNVNSDLIAMRLNDTVIMIQKKDLLENNNKIGDLPTLNLLKDLNSWKIALAMDIKMQISDLNKSKADFEKFVQSNVQHLTSQENIDLVYYFRNGADEKTLKRLLKLPRISKLWRLYKNTRLKHYFTVPSIEQDHDMIRKREISARSVISPVGKIYFDDPQNFNPIIINFDDKFMYPKNKKFAKNLGFPVAQHFLNLSFPTPTSSVASTSPVASTSSGTAIAGPSRIAARKPPVVFPPQKIDKKYETYNAFTSLMQILVSNSSFIDYFQTASISQNTPFLKAISKFVNSYNNNGSANIKRIIEIIEDKISGFYNTYKNDACELLKKLLSELIEESHDLVKSENSGLRDIIIKSKNIFYNIFKGTIQISGTDGENSMNEALELDFFEWKNTSPLQNFLNRQINNISPRLTSYQNFRLNKKLSKPQKIVTVFVDYVKKTQDGSNESINIPRKIKILNVEYTFMGACLDVRTSEGVQKFTSVAVRDDKIVYFDNDQINPYIENLEDIEDIDKNAKILFYQL